jgi:hypothetical protein
MDCVPREFYFPGYRAVHRYIQSAVPVLISELALYLGALLTTEFIHLQLRNSAGINLKLHL